MNYEGEPILPPEGENNGGRYESADIDIEGLRLFLEDTKFEREADINEFLGHTEKLIKRSSATDVEMGMTRMFRVRPTLKEKIFNHGLSMDKGVPLSGVDPKSVLEMTIHTLDEKKFHLSIYEVFNRNDKFRYEYVLTPAK